MGRHSAYLRAEPELENLTRPRSRFAVLRQDASLSGLPGRDAPMSRVAVARLGRILLAMLLLGGTCGGGALLLHREDWRRGLPASVPEAVGKLRLAALHLLAPARGR